MLLIHRYRTLNAGRCSLGYKSAIAIAGREITRPNVPRGRRILKVVKKNGKPYKELGFLVHHTSLLCIELRMQRESKGRPKWINFWAAGKSASPRKPLWALQIIALSSADCLQPVAATQRSLHLLQGDPSKLHWTALLYYKPWVCHREACVQSWEPV